MWQQKKNGNEQRHQLGQGITDPNPHISHEKGKHQDKQIYQEQPPKGCDSDRNFGTADGGKVGGYQNIETIQ